MSDVASEAVICALEKRGRGGVMERGEAFAFVRAPSTLMVFLHFARDD